VCKYKILTNSLPSRIYLLSLFNPMSDKRLSFYLHGDKKSKGDIPTYFKTFKENQWLKKVEIKPSKAVKYYLLPERSKYYEEKRDLEKKLPRDFDSREKLYTSNLNPIFEFWEKEFEKKKKAVVKLIKNKKLTKTFDKNDKKHSLENIDIKLITKEEIGILNDFFFNEMNFEGIRHGFGSYVLPEIMTSELKFNSLEILTQFFIILLKRSKTMAEYENFSIVRKNEMRNAKNDKRLQELESLAEAFEKRKLQNGFSLLDFLTLDLCKKISSGRIDELIQCLKIVSPPTQYSYELAKRLYGFNPYL